MSTVKNSILALFDDNLTGAITASDMRIFVEAIFDSKENEIHVFETLSDIDTYRSTSTNPYPISKFDLVVITDETHQENWGSERGIYISLKDAPSQVDVFKVSSLNYDKFIEQGQIGQLISLDSNKELTWIEPIDGYYIQGTDLITNILNKRPSQKGEIWIAENEELTAPVPGTVGDGYSWDGSKWNNIGQLRGPAGDVVQVAFANQYEVDSGYLDYKAISPKTFKNSTIILNKENKLGNPTQDGFILSSDTQGTRSWIKPVTYINDLDDVNYTVIDDNSLLRYNNGMWAPIRASDLFPNTFLGLSDTPSSYGSAGQAVVVNQSKDRLTFIDMPTKLAELEDVSDSLSPNDGDALVYNSASGLWAAAANLNAGITSQRPSNPRIGTQFFDVSLGIPVWFNGVSWVDANGTQR
jgi:hypothetical protein